MTLLIKILIATITTTFIVWIFCRTSGSLSINKLNMFSVAFYYLFAFFYIGSTIVFLGFRNHYLIQKVQNDAIFDYGYFIVSSSLIVFSFCCMFMNHALKVSSFKRFYNDYQRRPLSEPSCNEFIVFCLVVVLTLIGIGALLYTFLVFGSVPLFQLLFQGTPSSSLRVSMARGFSGNVYVRNILALTLIPGLSYLAYIYCKFTKQLKWRILFSILLFLSILAKTYSLEKAPVVIYLLYFFFIDTILGEKQNLRTVLFFASGAVILLVGMYRITGYENNILTIYEGPLSRLFFSQLSTLYLHLQAFPSIVGFMNGASFATILGGEGIRSGRVVMEIYNPAGVESGTAGVMNSMFVAEAYANYGVLGIMFAPIIVGFIVAFYSTVVMKQNKDPINVTIYVYLVSTFSLSLLGGFVDFFYSPTTFVFVMTLIIIKVLAGKGKLSFARIF